MKKIGQVSLVDLIKVPTQRTITDAGQMIVPCAFARTGVQKYTAKALGLVDRPENEMVNVIRDEAEVFSAESMASFRSAPVTIGHPVNDEGKQINVTSKNSKELQVGTLEGLPVRDEDVLKGNLVIARQDAIDLIDSGTVELSAGYNCDLMMNDDGDILQRNIRANHIAIVVKARGGSNLRIADEEELINTVATLTDELKTEKDLVSSLTDELKTEKELSRCTTDELSSMEAERDVAKSTIVTLKDELTQSIDDRVNIILKAINLTDIKDFTDKNLNEIRRMVVEDVMPNQDISGKTESYVNAMFDIIVDADKAETPMSKLLRGESTPAKIEDYSHMVKDARSKMIKRNKKRESTK